MTRSPGFGGHKRRGDDAARAAQRFDATLQREAAHAGFVAKTGLAGRLFADALNEFADLGGRVADGKPRNLLVSGIIYCDCVFFFVCVHANIGYTCVYDRLLSLYAALSPQGNNPRLPAATHRLVACTCLSDHDDLCNQAPVVPYFLHLINVAGSAVLCGARPKAQRRNRIGTEKRRLL